MPAPITDTERLDWTLAHTGANWDSDWRTGEHWIIWFHESYHYRVTGHSHRECIDSAIRGEAEKIL